jgi:Fuc2NAc and GlcNAc transferase
MTTALVVAFMVTAGLSWVGTGRVRRYAVAKALLDHPNERSSHAVPTPRGGGLALVLVILGGLVACGFTGALAPPTVMALVPAGALVAAVGWFDDRRGLSALVRFLSYTAAAGWVTCWLGPVDRLWFSDDGIALGPLAAPLNVLALVWVANAFNFMDGIDGIAGGMAFAAGTWGVILGLAGGSTEAAWVAALVAGGAAGFLPWNWMPARIFMGDVGSVFLGLMLGGVGMAADRDAAVPALMWALVLGPFLVDATLTLVRRVARREAWFAAHRSHAYQRAVQSGWSHAAVTTAVLGLAVLMGLLAWVTQRRPGLATTAAAVGLVVLLLAYGAVERRRPMGL